MFFRVYHMPFRSRSARWVSSFTPTRLRSVSEREHGGSAVELTLVLPVFLLLVFGIVDFSRAFLTQNALQAAAREGARVAIAARPVTDADVSAAVTMYLSGASVADPTIAVTPSADGAASGTVITVDASTNYEMIIFPRTLALRGTATMVKE